MSTFGDGTYDQRLYDAIKAEQENSGKTDTETVVTLIRILGQLTIDWPGGEWFREEPPKT